MREHLRKSIGNLNGLAVIVDEAIGRLRPFQNDIGAVFTMECEETTIQRLTCLFEHTHLDLDTCLAELTDASTLNFSEFIDASHHHTAHTFSDNQVGTRGCLTIMRTGFERHIDGGLAQQCLILRAHRGESIHFGMALATADMVALADDTSVGTYDDRPHHGVGFGVLLSVLGQLYAALHEFLVVYHYIIVFFI